MSEPGVVTAYRNGFPESHHRVHAVAVRTDGSVIGTCGDPDRVTTLRSAAKPFQAEPLIASGGLDALGLDDRVLAVMCASHAGQDIHVEALERGLAACGLDASALQNSLGTPEERLRHNCSGNHLALPRPLRPPRLGDGRLPPARASVPAGGAGRDGRPRRRRSGHDPHHDRRLRRARLRPAAARDRHHVRPSARAAAAPVRGDDGPSRARCAATATSTPRRCAAIPGCVSKGGAEALSCIGLAGEGIGVAVRIDDGNARASAPAALAVLRAAARLGRAARRTESVVRAGAAELGGRPGRAPAGPGEALLTS